MEKHSENLYGSFNIESSEFSKILTGEKKWICLDVFVNGEFYNNNLDKIELKECILEIAPYRYVLTGRNVIIKITSWDDLGGYVIVSIEIVKEK